MGKVQFGLIMPEHAFHVSRRRHYMEDVNRLLDTVKGHFDSAWCIDHLEGLVLEGWTALTYLSALHPELQWGHSVLSQSFRNPALLAKMVATLDYMSGGRYILGIGAGGMEADYLTYGYPFPPGRTRVAELEEALQIIKAMWSQERVTFEGRHYSIKDASCEPRPDHMPTVMIGAFRPQMLRLAAKHADWWNVSSTGITDYRRHVEEFQRACDAVGRDPATVRQIWGGGCVCAPGEAEVAELAAERGQLLGEEFAYQVGEDFVGTPAQLVEQMQPFIELGVDYFLLDCGGFPRLTTVEMLAHEVLPVLNL